MLELVNVVDCKISRKQQEKKTINNRLVDYRTLGVKIPLSLFNLHIGLLYKALAVVKNTIATLPFEIK